MMPCESAGCRASPFSKPARDVAQNITPQPWLFRQLHVCHLKDCRGSPRAVWSPMPDGVIQCREVCGTAATQVLRESLKHQVSQLHT
jgi:hypothetical protein